ncbi:hypothetical protein [Streptomyces longwoodensis]|uniref:hypothetical protein n=1 Tax=Streptomyces longwoodensis TaxID=68231 RepID=UPI0033E32544
MTGPEQLLPDQRDEIAELIGDVKPASPGLLVSFGQSVRNRREHEHPKWEDLYCMNLSSYMGERIAPVLRRLLDVEAEAEALRARVAEMEAAQRTVYRASHDSIVMGLYDTREAARAHCEAEERRSWTTGSAITFAWIPDDSDPMSPEELSVFAGQNEESVTGYVVTPLEIAAEYDEEADEA